jgi:nucleoside-diphosphate-sugar epimerase
VTGPINLGNPEEYTIREFADEIIYMTGSRSHIVYEPLPQDDPLQRKPVISKASELLGWSPKVPLQEGLQRTVDYFSLGTNLAAVAPQLALAGR